MSDNERKHEEQETEISPTEKPDEITATATPTPAEIKTEVKTYAGIVKANPLYSEASKIFHWKDPVKSGLLFGILNLFYILFTWGEYSLITLTSYLLLSVLTVCFGYAKYVVLKAAWLNGKTVENPFKERFKNHKFHVKRETIDVHVATLLDLINLTIDEYREVFYITDITASVKAAVTFYLAAWVGDVFSGITIFYLVLLGFFLWPRLYQEKQKEIDHFAGIAKTQANVYFQLALTKLPPAVTARFPQLKPKSN